MKLHAAPIPRHRWVHIVPACRTAVAASGDTAAAREATAVWLERGLPLVARTHRPGEAAHLHPLGLCLPLGREQRRVALMGAPEAVARVHDAAPLREVARILPPAARAMAVEIADTAAALGFEARAFGSAAWQWRGGEGYLHEASDLDVLAAPGSAQALARWLALLTRLDATAAMRIDGEIECPSGDAVNWRELARAPREVLVKRHGSACLSPLDAVLAQFA